MDPALLLLRFLVSLEYANMLAAAEIASIVYEEEPFFIAEGSDVTLVVSRVGEVLVVFLLILSTCFLINFEYLISEEKA